MSYSIIFETKIVKLSDGRIIHFDRSGCNNDNAGRRKDDFSARIYTVDEFVQKAERFKKDRKPFKDTKSMDLKIGSRCATYYDYGEHLLRMLRRAKSYSDFINSMCFRVEHLTGVELLKPYEKKMTVEEFDHLYYELRCSGKGFTYSRMVEYPDIRDEKNLVRLIEAKEPLFFEIKSW